MKKKSKTSRLINIGAKSDVVPMEKGLFDVTDSPMVYSKKKGKRKGWVEHATWMDRGLGAKGIELKKIPGWNKIKGFKEWKEARVDEALLPDWLKLPEWFPKLPSIEELPDLLSKIIKTSNIIPISTLFFYFAKKLFSGSKDNAKLRFVFPKKDWEFIAIKFLKELGVITAVFKTIDDAIKEVESLEKIGVKANEIIIGSHNSEDGFILNPMNKGKKGMWSFLLKLRSVIKPETTLFFTACGGADQLRNLVDIADTLQHPVSGAAGIYNYIMNTAEKGYYVCRPITDEDKEKIDRKYGEEGLSDNKALLEFAVCKKIPKSPISWIEPIK